MVPGRGWVGPCLGSGPVHSVARRHRRTRTTASEGSQIAHKAADCGSGGALARPQPDAIWTYTDYDHLVPLAQVTHGPGTIRPPTDGSPRDVCALSSIRCAAKFGSGSGPWAQGVGARSGGAIGQATEGSCVSACGAVLSGRSQAELLGMPGDWSNPQALARELGEGWTGGFFGSADDALAGGKPWAYGSDARQAPGRATWW